MSGKTKKEEVVIKDVLGNELKKEEFPLNFNLPEGNGAKSQESNSPNFHRHHEKLSKKIQELCDLSSTNRSVLDLLISLIPEEVIEKATKKYGTYLYQKARVNSELRKLEEAKKDLVKIQGVYNT